MDWKDIEVGDYISITFKSRITPHLFFGEITQIIHCNHQTDITLDPLAYSIFDDYYEFRLKTQGKYGFHEYVLNSLFWNLINIIKKGGTTTMPLEIGKKYKVNIPNSWEDPEQNEFTGELVEIDSRNTLSYLIYSKELEDNKHGHNGSKFANPYGCWWCKPEWLTPLEPEPTKETIKLEDIFNE